ncbi:MAG: hypothetical protein ACXVEF_31695 [Polyangiales bacterium]
MRVSICVLAFTIGCSGSINGDGTADPGDGSTADDTGSSSADGDVTDSTTTDDSTVDDSGSPTDSGTTATDSGTATDGGTKTDSGTVTDTGTTMTDGGTTGSTVMVGPCRMYPPDNPWNQDITKLPVHPKAADFATTMHLTTALHPDWGTYAEGYGIPYNTGTGAAAQKMTWTVSWGPASSDKLACTDGSGYQWCYPIPTTCKIEGPSDSHLLFLDTAGAPNNCTLYELWRTQAYAGSGWHAANGAIFHLGTNALRPDGMTSADAAGLPILPGLVRFDEANAGAGAIKHAIRFTMGTTYQGYIHPATHAAGDPSDKQPPMGLRMRLKASVPIGSYSKWAQAILQAMKTYGIILADNGSDWYITGEEHDGWKGAGGGGKTVMETVIDAFDAIHGSDFEPVDTGATSTAGL